MRARRGQELYQRWRDGDLPRTVRCRDVEAVLETYLPGRYSRGPDGSYIIRHVAFAALSGRHAGLRVQAQQQRWDRWAVEELMLRIAWIREWRWWCQMNGWDEDEFQDLEVLKLRTSAAAAFENRIDYDDDTG